MAILIMCCMLHKVQFELQIFESSMKKETPISIKSQISPQPVHPPQSENEKSDQLSQ